MKQRPLMAHQVKALEFSRQKSEVGLFMEMRLGKTIVAIRWTFLKGCVRVLLIAPLSVLPGWEKELIAEGVHPDRIHYVHGSLKKKLLSQKSVHCGWYLINFEALRCSPRFCNFPWEAVVVDESTRIRNPQAKITKLCLRNLKHVPNRMILSGLPAPESSLNYFTQMSFLNQELLGYDVYWNFRRRFYSQGWTSYIWLPKPGTLDAINRQVRKSCFVLTRKDAGVGSKKVYETRYVPMNSVQKKLHRKADRDFALELKDRTLLTKWAPVRTLWMSRIASGVLVDEDKQVVICSENKCKEVLDLVTGELNNELTILIWFRFNAELFHLKDYLYRKAALRSITITGADSLNERKRKMEDLHKQHRRGNRRLLLAQVKCGRYGLDCSMSSTAIYFSNMYEYEDRSQSEDRIIHPKKKEPVLYIDLVSKGSIDEHVVEVLKDKHRNSRPFMTNLFNRMKEHYGTTKLRINRSRT